MTLGSPEWAYTEEHCVVVRVGNTIKPSAHHKPKHYAKSYRPKHRAHLYIIRKAQVLEFTMIIRHSMLLMLKPVIVIVSTRP